MCSHVLFEYEKEKEVNRSKYVCYGYHGKDYNDNTNDRRNTALESITILFLVSQESHARRGRRVVEGVCIYVVNVMAALTHQSNTKTTKYHRPC